MKREKIARKIGDSVGFIFNKEERDIGGIKIGEIFNITVEKKGDKK